MKLLSITAAAATLLAVPALTWTIEDAHGRVFQGSESDAGCHRYVTFPKGSKITYKVAEGYSLDFFTDKHCTVDKPAVGFSGSRKDAEMYREGQSFMFCPDVSYGTLAGNFVLEQRNDRPPVTRNRQRAPSAGRSWTMTRQVITTTPTTTIKRDEAHLYPSIS